MENLTRQEISINLEVMDMLNEQIEKEQKASSVYLAMASWCDQRTLINSATFFYKQAEEEREHMMKIFKFINDTGGSAYSPNVSGITHEFSSLKKIFETALQHVIAISQSIMWFVEEQVEEEETIKDILDMFDLSGDMPLQYIDERIPVDK